MSIHLDNPSDPLLPTPVTSEIDEHQPTAPLATMGVSQSTARIIAPGAYLFNFFAQNYAILIANPNMEMIHNKNPAAFSPHPFAIGGFFSMQQIIQVLYLRELFREDSSLRGSNALRYAPWFALGNVSIAIWAMFWNKDNLQGSMVPVLINTTTQLYYVFALRDKRPTSYQSQLVNLNCITMAGIGILDVFHNASAGFFTKMAPNTLVQVATSVAAPLVALTAPLSFAACVVYDLFGVAVGQHTFASQATIGYGGGGGEGWARWVAGLGVGMLGIIGARAYNGAQWL